MMLFVVKKTCWINKIKEYGLRQRRLHSFPRFQFSQNIYLSVNKIFGAREGQVCLSLIFLTVVYIIVVIRIIFTFSDIMFILGTTFVAYNLQFTREIVKL